MPGVGFGGVVLEGEDEDCAAALFEDVGAFGFALEGGGEEVEGRGGGPGV